MQTREVHTRDSFIEAQLDTVSNAARTLLPLIGADLWFTGEAAPEGTPERLPPAGAGDAGRMERRDERASARTADLFGLAARPAGPADPRRDRADGRRVHPSRPGLHRAGLPQHRRRRRLVRRDPVLAGRNLHRIWRGSRWTRRCCGWSNATARTSKAGAGAMRIRRRRTIRCWAMCRCCAIS